MVKVLYNNKLSLVLMVYEVAVKPSSHAIRHSVIYPIIKAVKRSIDDKNVGIKFSIYRQIFPQHHYHHCI